MAEPFCASSPEAAVLSDEEFWAKVYPQPEQDWEPDIDDYPEMVVGYCLRCGSVIMVEDYEEARELIDADCEICEGCTDELLPDLEDDLPSLSS